MDCGFVYMRDVVRGVVFEMNDSIEKQLNLRCISSTRYSESLNA